VEDDLPLTVMINPIRVLIVEDEALVALDLSAQLDSLGFKIIGRAVKGESALDFLIAHEADVILMDISLKGAMDGITTAEEIARVYDVPVVFITGANSQETVERIKKTNPYGYIVKPFDQRVVGVIVETAVSKHAVEKALRKQKELYQNLIETIPDVICELTADGRIQFVSDAVAYFGHDKETLTDRPFETLVYPLDIDAVHAAFFKNRRVAMQARSVMPRVVMPILRFRLMRPLHDQAHGSFHMVEARFIPHYNARSSNGFDGWVGIVRDITAQEQADQSLRLAKDSLEGKTKDLERQQHDISVLCKELEAKNAELLKYQEHLEDLVRERTREAEDARTEAEKANRLKTEFLANMSHELRSPLHSVLSFAKLGLERYANPDREKLKYYFDVIVDNGQRLLALLTDLLDLSKLEASGMNYTFTKESPAVVVAEIIEELRPMSDVKKIRCLVESDVGDVKVMIDRRRMQQVFRNILVNAMKFSIEGDAVTVRFREEAGEFEAVVIDTGIGIPEDQLDLIFEKFVQSDRTKTGAGGSGLGLAIARQIVLDHGGRLWAEPNPEGGSMFVMRLPLTATHTERKPYRRLGEVLVELGLLTDPQLEKALKEQARRNASRRG